MPTSITELPYEVFLKHGDTIEKDLDAAIDWLSSIGLNPTVTRFGEYRKSIKNLHQDLDGNNKTEDVFYKFLNAHMEITDLLRIKSTFESEDSSTYIERLKKVTSGTAFRNYSEKDQSRDFAFELSIASRFISAKIPIDLTSIADVIANLDDTKLFIECKRIKSMQQLGRRVKSSQDQLKKRISSQTSSKCKGISAICLTDIINSGNKMSVVENVHQLKKISSSQLNSFGIENRDILEGRRLSGVLGTFCEYSMQGFSIKRDTENSDVAVINCRGALFVNTTNGQREELLVNKYIPQLANQSA